MQDDHRAQPLGQRHDIRIAQVGADLRQVGSLERAGVDIDERVTVRDYVREERVRDAGCRAAIGVAGKIPVEVAAVGQVARAAPKSLHVDDRHADDGPGEPPGVEVVQNPPHHLDAVEFVAVHGRREAQGRAG